MDGHFSSVFQKFEALKNQNYPLNLLMQKSAELLRAEISHYDWVGFYILDLQEDVLVLGPYSGASTEHTRIPVGKGICGQVAASGETMIIQDVSSQDNYLSCSIDVQSEIVVPILKNGFFVAEIDIDSHAYAPFTQEDEKYLTLIAKDLADLF